MTVSQLNTLGMMTRMILIAPLLFFVYLVVIAISVVSFAAAAADDNNNNGNSEEVRVPVIDLGPWLLEKTKNKTNHFHLLTEEQRNIVQQIQKACKDVGFFQITGVIDSDDDQELFQRTWNASREFFDLSTNEKLLHQTTDGTKYPYGYERTEILTKGKMMDNKNDDEVASVVSSQQQLADLKETFAVGPPDENGSGMPSRQWIDSSSSNISIKDFQSSLEAYYRRMEDLALIVLEIFSLALDESPTFFENKMDHHMSALRLVHYYPLLEQQQQQHPSTSTMQKNKSSTRLIRAGAHTDYGALTILATQKEGLEVLLRDNTNTSSDDKNESDDNEIKQRWFPVPLVPGSLIVNLGDLMQRWTNDEWVSTMHRVVMPSTEAHERRYSMAYFVNINGDTPIEPLKCCRGGGGGGGGGGGSGVDDDDSTSKYKVITAGEHLMAKHLASMGIADGKDEDIESAINGEL